ncbi:MAG: hypothetical protein CM1200mP30_25790 [Pseudomonadota bacterium]|nr:MAG: hypothetical protein CM1200mP30_25790 [Pseudomonadota bacterium]
MVFPNKIEPPGPVDKDLYDLKPEEMKDIKSVVGSLDAALDALEEDHAFLLKGMYYTGCNRHVAKYKREREVDAMRLRPHPYEFSLYYDVKFL